MTHCTMSEFPTTELHILKNFLQIEKYVLYKNCGYTEYNVNWAPWQRFLKLNNHNN